jgi:hypothetical protein
MSWSSSEAMNSIEYGDHVYCNSVLTETFRLNLERSLPHLQKLTVLLISSKLSPIKVKFTLQQAMKLQRGSAGIALLFL